MNDWYPNATRIDGDPNARYWPDEYKRGVILHSADGYRPGMESLIRAPGAPSWAFSIFFNGEIAQHYPVEVSTWHAGDYQANLDLIGIEIEGRGLVGSDVLMNPINDMQINAIIQILSWLRDRFNWGTLVRHDNIFEHNEISSTSCPDGRLTHDVWNQILEGVNDYMANGQEILELLNKWEQEDEHESAREHVAQMFEAAAAFARLDQELPRYLKKQIKYVLG